MSSLSLGALMHVIWPFLIAAAAWGIAVWALQQPDAHSELVRRLTAAKPGRGKADARISISNPNHSTKSEKEGLQC